METKKFKCKDEVIYRRTDEKSEWTYGIFSHYYDYNNVKGVVVDGHFLLSTVHSILPYEGNEHLVGTELPADEEVRLEEGELLICTREIEDFIGIFGRLCHFVRLDGDCFEVEDADTFDMTFKYAIRFSDFNPNDMEATKDKILCVKNGKIVRYKD